MGSCKNSQTNMSVQIDIISLHTQSKLPIQLVLKVLKLNAV